MQRISVTVNVANDIVALINQSAPAFFGDAANVRSYRPALSTPFPAKFIRQQL
jgi:hypothetical protein